jgi:hypothetical protein
MRTLAWILAVFYMVNGLAMIAAPAWWYGATPGVPETGPYNSHFVVDVGIAFAVSGAMIAWGAYGAGWRLVLAGSAFPAGHAIFHILGFVGGHRHGPLAVEIFGVVVPAVLTIWAAWAMRSKERAT